MSPKERKSQLMRIYRKQWRWEQLVAKGQCPVCGMLLKYENYHKGCPYLITTQNVTIVEIKS